jgi:glycosyltransferase involved in cell wall biosynthesis
MKSRPRLIIYSSHPIQYQVPWFRALHDSGEVDLLVVFSHQPSSQEQGSGFGVAFQWDVNLLDGYRWRVASVRKSVIAKPGFFQRVLVDPALELNQHRADVALLTGWQEFPLVQWLRCARSHRIPTIMRGESNLLRPRRLASQVWHRYILEKCDAVITIGTANQAFYEHYAVSRARMFSAPYFVDNEYFAAAARVAQSSRQDTRKQWGVSADTVCFCFVGKLEHKKRVLVLLKALAVARARSARPLHLLVVGAGEQQVQARHVVETDHLPVTFAGFLNQGEIAQAYDASDCLVLPSDAGETWGLVVNEAMACARPAIVSDHVGCQLDLVQDGVTGFVVPLDNVEALASALCKAAESDLRAMGLIARERVASTCSVDRATRATLDAVKSLLTRNTA